MSLPVVAIVGRPNVGKSTLFNRIVGRRVAVVHSLPGVTRDRLSRVAEWRGAHFDLVDTGGMDFAEEDTLEREIAGQIQLALESAQVILFVADAKEGPTARDAEIAERLHRLGKEVLLIANKVDNERIDLNVPEMHSLGFPHVFGLSALHGRDVSDLLDAIVERLPREERGGEEEVIRVAVLGRPNVGKSTYVNRVLKQRRLVVHEAPGTTRDAVDIPFESGDQQYIFIDTAGIRKKGKVRSPVERFSVSRATESVKRSDVVLLLVDATEGITRMEERILDRAEDEGKAIVIAFNKWDLVERRNEKAFLSEAHRDIRMATYAPMIFLSALKGRGMKNSLRTIRFVADQASRTLPTPLLNKVIQKLQERTQPPMYRGKRLKIFYGTQVGVRPPTFLLFVNSRRCVHPNYGRYIENTLRDFFGFEGTPLRVRFRSRREKG